MNLVTAIVVLLPSCLSLCVSGVYAYIALKKAKEPPKDEVWETATKLLCSRTGGMADADDFAALYEELKFFKDCGCTIPTGETLAHLTLERKRQEKQVSAPSSTSL